MYFVTLYFFMNETVYRFSAKKNEILEIKSVF